MIFSPHFKPNLFDLNQVSFSVATENKCEYLADEIIKCFAIVEFIALRAGLVIKFDTAFSNFASGKTAIVLAGFAFSLSV